MNLSLNKSLFKGSIVLLITFGIYNFLNFLYHLLMARSLSIEEYGTLSALLFFSYILIVPFVESMQTLIAKYSASETDDGKINNVLRRISRRIFRAATWIIILYLIALIPLYYFTRIPIALLLLNGMVIFGSLFVPITRGCLQGKKRFFSLGGNMIIESVTKVVVGIILVYLGFAVFGALIAFIAAIVLSLLFSIAAIKDILRKEQVFEGNRGIHGYTKQTLLIVSLIVIAYNFDILLAKILFNDTLAGYYAVSSVLSKAIFWGTQPISKAMFPLTSDKDNVVKKRELLMNALLAVGVMSGIALVIFYFFSNIIIYIFSGRVISESIVILPYLGLGSAILAISNVILLYKLSIDRTRGYVYLIIPVVLGIALMIIYSTSLLSYSIAFIASSVLLLLASIVLLNRN